MWHRIGESSNIASILQNTELKEFLTKDDVEDLDAAEAQANDEKEIFKDISKKIRHVRKKGRSKSKGKDGKDGARKPVNFESDKSWSTGKVQSLMPENYKVYRDAFNGCWRVYTKKKCWSCSKSWGLSGEDGPAVRVIAEAAWNHHMSLQPDAGCPWKAG